MPDNMPVEDIRNLRRLPRRQGWEDEDELMADTPQWQQQGREQNPVQKIATKIARTMFFEPENDAPAPASKPTPTPASSSTPASNFVLPGRVENIFQMDSKPDASYNLRNPQAAVSQRKSSGPPRKPKTKVLPRSASAGTVAAPARPGLPELPVIDEETAQPRNSEYLTSRVGSYTEMPKEILDRRKQIEAQASSVPARQQGPLLAQVAADVKGTPQRYGGAALAPVPAFKPEPSMSAFKDAMRKDIEGREQAYESAMIVPPYDAEEVARERYLEKRGFAKERKPGVWNTIKDFARSGASNVARMRAEQAAAGDGLTLGETLGGFLGGGVGERLDREGARRREWESGGQGEFQRKEGVREKLRSRQIEEEGLAAQRESRGWERSRQEFQRQLEPLMLKMQQYQAGRQPTEDFFKDFSTITNVLNQARQAGYREEELGIKREQLQSIDDFRNASEREKEAKTAQIGEAKTLSQVDRVKIERDADDAIREATTAPDADKEEAKREAQYEVDRLVDKFPDEYEKIVKNGVPSYRRKR